MDLNKYILRQILGFGRVAEHPVSQIHYRLLVLVHQLSKSAHIALFDAQHQGGIRVVLGGHAQLGDQRCSASLFRTQYDAISTFRV